MTPKIIEKNKDNFGQREGGEPYGWVSYTYEISYMQSGYHCAIITKIYSENTRCIKKKIVAKNNVATTQPPASFKLNGCSRI